MVRGKLLRRVIDETICSALLVVNCRYVVGDYRAAGSAVNMPILAHINHNQFLRRFQNVRSIFANIAKE